MNSTQIHPATTTHEVPSAEVARQRELLEHLVSNPDATIDDYRDLYDEVLTNFVLPDDATSEAVDADGVPCFWVSAPGADEELVTVVVHGGAWSMGNAKGYREFGYRISAASGSRTLVVDYRLSPENPFPIPLDDTVVAYRWAQRQPGVRSVALVGDSAGGGLVAGALVQLRDAGDAAPAAAVLVSPLLDLAGEGASMVERAGRDPLPAAALIASLGAAYLDGRDAKQTPLASPLYAELHDLPPTLVLVGTEECLYDDSVRYEEKSRAAGNDVELVVGEGLYHIYPLFNFLPEGRAATERLGAFLKSHFTAPAN